MKQRLPYNCHYFPVLVFILLGLADTVYLAVSHYKNHTDLAYAKFCIIPSPCSSGGGEKNL